jgi:hypothetical protein
MAACSDAGTVAGTGDGSVGENDATMADAVDGPSVDAMGDDGAADGSLADAPLGDASLDVRSDGTASTQDASSDGAAPTDSGAVGDAVEEGLLCNPIVGAPYKPEGATCYYLVDLSCPAYPIQRSIPCSLVSCDVCTVDAAPNFGCEYVSGCPDSWEGGPVTVECATCVNAGRRPAGLARECARNGNALADYFARAAHLEAASVHAFERLREELAHHGAPIELRKAATAAARDERRHARVVGRFASYHGAPPLPVRIRRRGARSLERMAVENAVEGCVRETFGALLATWQSASAQDPELRRSMKRIAVDETRHAALAWAIDEWITPRLGTAGQRRVRLAVRRAVARLRREVRGTPARDLVAAAGLPSAHEASVLVDRLSRALWSRPGRGHSGVSTYPTPRTVLSSRGLRGSSPSL